MAKPGPKRGRNKAGDAAKLIIAVAQLLKAIAMLIGAAALLY